MLIEHATLEDAPAILDLQKLAYRSEVEIYSDPAIPPMLQTLEHIQGEFRHFVFLKLMLDNSLIGSVRALKQNETCYIAKLIVHPVHQNRGYGKALMREIEATFPEATRFELFTGNRSTRNLSFYQKLGYTEYRREEVTPDLTLIFLEKFAIRTSNASTFVFLPNFP